MAGKRHIAAGEVLAIDPAAIRRDADGLFWIIGDGTPGNSRHHLYPDVAIIHVRGSLEHHITPGTDSYEGILDKIDDAMGGKDSDEPRDPPSAVIMCIDSRGGVVAGLNSTIAAIRQLRKDRGVPLVAYVNEMATSAAYALGCACDEIIGPKSCVTGSIGTISTMISVAEQDKAMGVDVRLITSGTRKADGHPHAPITDGAVAAERDRVNKLSADFFEIASAARGIPVKKLSAMQAAIFLGPDAKARGLLDSVLSLDAVASALTKRRDASPRPSAKGNETDRRARA